MKKIEYDEEEVVQILKNNKLKTTQFGKEKIISALM